MRNSNSPACRRNDAKANYEAELYKLNAKRLASVNAKYDALDTTKNTGKRRVAKIETESEEKYSLTNRDRLKSINLARDAERNFSPVKTIQRQLKTNVIGTGVKMRLNIADAALGKEIADWFNTDYAKNCDGRDDLHLCEQAALTLASFKREGDVGIFFDADGKLLFFESDQLPEIEKGDWEKQTIWVEPVTQPDGKKKKMPLLQEQGVVFDRMGRRKAFVVSAKHGQSTVKLTEATIVPAESFKLIKAVFRLNQIRGVSELLPILNDALDLYELRASELQSAKLASKYAGAITKIDAMETGIIRSGTDAEGLLDAPVAAGAQNTYEAFEQLSGGFFEYLEPGEKVEFFNSNRPNNGLKDFFSFVLTGAGASWGIAKTYTSLDCEKSYFAARGDMLLTWATFYVEQKFMERHFFDWVGARAVAYAAKSKGWKLDEGWQSKMSWIFPTMPLLDELKAANTNAANLDNLLTDFSELLGPDWQEKLRQRSEQDKFLKGIGLSRVHAVTGGSNTDTEKETEKDTTTDTGDSKNEQ